MKKLHIIAALVVAGGVSLLFATGPSVYVGYFLGPAAQQSQATFSYGIDHATGTDLYIAERNVNRIYKVSNSGSIISSFNFPPLYPMGVAFDGTYLWIARGFEPGETGVSAIYRYTTAGSQVSSFPTAPIDSASQYPTGTEWDGTYVWYCDRYTKKIYKCTTSGSRVASYYTPGSEPEPNPRDLSLDPDGHWWVVECNPASTPVVASLWYASSTFSPIREYPEAYFWTTTGGLLAPSGTDGFNPRGIWHDAANNMFYLGDCTFPGLAEPPYTNYIYKLSSGTRVETKSMGQIKSLYR